jgi:putative hemolysin
MNQALIWGLFLVCMAISFLLSGMEAGVFALSRLRIRRQMRAGRRSARALYTFLEQPENFLWTIFVGNTLANAIILGWLVVILDRWLHARVAVFAAIFAVIVFLFYALSDLLPKMLFRAYPNRLCLMMARPFKLIHWMLRPLVALVESVSGLLLLWRGGRVFTGHLFGNREEMRLVMQESGQNLTSDERAMINRVLDLQSLTVRQVMVPWPLVVTVGREASIEAALELCRVHKRTRLPITDSRERGSRIIGLFSVNAVLYQNESRAGKTAGDFAKPALYLDEDMRLEVALRRMQRGGQRLAIVLGRDRLETGLLSLQDVLKAVFGEVSL